MNNGKKLTQKELTITDRKDYEMGDLVPNIDQSIIAEPRLIHIPVLEEIVWAVPREFVVRNPNQPRQDFPKKEIKGLADAIERKGQIEPAVLNPILGARGKIAKLLILAGEMRDRAQEQLGSPTLKAIITYDPDHESLFETSTIENIARTDLNPIERGKAYKTLIAKERRQADISESKAIEIIAKNMKISTSQVRDYLLLITLDPEIQQQIINKVITPSGAVVIAKEKKKYGDKLDVAMFARTLLKRASGVSPGRPSKDGTSKKAPGKITKMGVKALLQEQVARRVRGETLPPGEEDRAKAEKNVVELYGAISEVRRILANVLDPQLIPLEIEATRDREYVPPERQYGQLNDLREGLQQYYNQVLKQALKPPPIVKPEGNRTFRQILGSQRKLFEDDNTMKRLAEILADASDDNGNTKSSVEITEILARENIKIDPRSIAPKFRGVISRLNRIGLTVEKYIRRTKAARGDLNKISVFRMEPLTQAKNSHVDADK